MTDTATVDLVWPHARYLPGYVDALARGWSADNVRGETAAREELARIEADAAAFLAALVDREARGAPVTPPDGSVVPRLPGFRKWIVDGDGAFCGSVGLRWQPGTMLLPPWCLGHIGYAVVPWMRGRGCATRALGRLLGDARAEGLVRVEITTDPHNLASQRVILANGGVLVERFVAPAAYGATDKLRFRIDLSNRVAAPATAPAPEEMP